MISRLGFPRCVLGEGQHFSAARRSDKLIVPARRMRQLVVVRQLGIDLEQIRDMTRGGVRLVAPGTLGHIIFRAAISGEQSLAVRAFPKNPLAVMDFPDYAQPSVVQIALCCHIAGELRWSVYPFRPPLSNIHPQSR